LTVFAELEKTGHVARGFLGVTTQAISPAMAKALHIPQNKGALVASVEDGSPASKAGVEPGDVIVSVNGKPVTNPRDLAIDVANVKPGETSSIDLLRDGAQKSLSVAVAEQAYDQVAQQDQSAHAEKRGKVGLALAPVSPETRSQFDLPDNVKGAVVAGVRPGSPAEAAGIEAGDVVIGVGNHSVATPEEAVKAIRAAIKDKGASLALRIMHNGQTSYIAVPLGNENEG